MKLNAIIIDDDRPAIEELEDALAAAGLTGRVEGYTEAAAGIHAIKDSRPDIVLLDIQMPGLNGLEAARELRQTASGCEVVFVTAYAEHAVEAFGLAAFDYLLKPVDPKRLRQTLERIWKRKQPKEEPGVERAEIRLFGSLRVAGPGGQVKWRTAKSSELFAYLFLNREVAQDRIIDDLFLGGRTDNAKVYLHTSIYQLRKSLAAAGLGEQLSIHYDKQNYRLESINLNSDIERFEQIADSSSQGKEALFRAVTLYGGSLLEGMNNLWLVERRERSRRQFIAMAARLVELLQSNGEWRQALEIALRLHLHDPLNDSLALHVARLYVGLGQRRLADDYIQRYMKQYHDEMGMESPGVAEEYRRLLE
ncbi:response regulator [Cohnella cellulosilytica]|uniref:Response regulator n=1 Tax=Cohnella cellulosilytica TaxID=986710 RepID=A0ABW2FGB6_9BACL